jgi:aspartate/methionine/tyrosine aminotransferase
MFSILSRARELERQGKKFIHFELGDPDFDSPKEVKREIIKQIKKNNTHYAPSRGIDELIEAAADVTEKSRGFRPEKEQLLVTPGANIQIYLALSCVVDVINHCEIAFNSPYFPSYLSQVVACNSAEAIGGLEREVNDWTKAVIINSPCNPTGVVLTKNEMHRIYDICKERDILLISDEVYSRMIYDPWCEFFSPSMIDHCKERVLVVNGFSKSFAMTGYRLGVATGPAELIRRMMVLQETILSCVPPFIQMAGVAALKSGQRYASKMAREYMRRRDIVCQRLDLGGFEYIKPQGGMYVFVKCPIKDDKEFALAAMDDGVLVSPGYIFGQPGWFRIAFCVGPYDIYEGVQRLCKTKNRLLNNGCQ